MSLTRQLVLDVFIAVKSLKLSCSLFGNKKLNNINNFMLFMLLYLRVKKYFICFVKIAESQKDYGFKQK